jgi:hypothetical protein
MPAEAPSTPPKKRVRVYATLIEPLSPIRLAASSMAKVATAIYDAIAPSPSSSGKGSLSAASISADNTESTENSDADRHALSQYIERRYKRSLAIAAWVRVSDLLRFEQAAQRRLGPPRDGEFIARLLLPPVQRALEYESVPVLAVRVPAHEEHGQVLVQVKHHQQTAEALGAAHQRLKSKGPWDESDEEHEDVYRELEDILLTA